MITGGYLRPGGITRILPGVNTPTPAAERLQKLFAAAGLGSRRAVEEWIRAGRVTLNGRVAQLGDKAGPADVVCLDGNPVALTSSIATERRLIAYNKPLDEVTTRSDPQGRRTVFESLPPVEGGRWISIGRLDVNTSGLLLFTTDGELAHRLMHPSTEVEREYQVTVKGDAFARNAAAAAGRVTLDDGPARFDSLEQLPRATLRAQAFGRTPLSTLLSGLILREGATARFAGCGWRWGTRSLGCPACATGRWICLRICGRGSGERLPIGLIEGVERKPSRPRLPPSSAAQQIEGVSGPFQRSPIARRLGEGGKKVARRSKSRANSN